MASDNQQVLEPFLSSPARPEGTLRFHELQGFLFTIACAPEMIMPSEWMPLVFNEEEPGYEDMTEAEAVTQALMAEYNEVNRLVLEKEVRLPGSVEVAKVPLDNVGEQAALGQWSHGFLMGHEWLKKLWDHYTPAALEEELGSSLMVLSLFFSQELAEAYHQEVVPAGDEPLEAFVGKLLAMFEDAMAGYAHLGRSIYEATLQQQELARQPRVSPDNKVGRNDPCPCGSGRKYKHCCLQ